MRTFRVLQTSAVLKRKMTDQISDSRKPSAIQWVNRTHSQLTTKADLSIHLLKYGMTVATCVCCSMISDTHT